MQNKKVGTFCIIISKQLAVSNCPLPKEVCVWKHRVTGQCKHDLSISDVTVFDLAKLTGRPVPTEDHLLETKVRLLEAIQNELKGA